MKNNKSSFIHLFFLIAVSFLFSCQHTSEHNTVTGNTAIKTDSINEVDSATFSKLNKTILQKPSGWVTDNENILDANSIAELTKLITDWRDRTSVEIAVVTTSTYAPYDSITPYSVALGNQWGVGQKEINNGILIVVSTTQREVRISPGLGMEQLLPDSVCQQIVIEKMLPSFKKGNYPEGIINGVKEIIRMLEAQMKPIQIG